MGLVIKAMGNNLRKTPWDQRYAADDYVYGTVANDFLREQVAQIPKGRVLCLGEGEGRNAVFLAEQGYSVTAVDQSSVGLAKCQALAEKRGVRVETIFCDLAEYEIEAGAWQGIVSIFCHTPAPIRQRLHGQLAKGLSSTGVFVLEAYTSEQLKFGTGGPPVAELMMELTDLREELKGLHILLGQTCEREIQEGRLHHGMGAVVQVLASK